MREITAVLYLNDPLDAPPAPLVTREGSTASHAPAAGALLLYPDSDLSDTSGMTSKTVVEIAPVGGRLVLFKSRSMLHEVTPHTNPNTERLALTLWIGGPHDLWSLLAWPWSYRW